jgi:hypothetical protein
MYNERTTDHAPILSSSQISSAYKRSDYLDNAVNRLAAEMALQMYYVLKLSFPGITERAFLNNKTKLKKLRGRSPQANYTDRETAACRRS